MSTIQDNLEGFEEDPWVLEEAPWEIKGGYKLPKGTLRKIKMDKTLGAARNVERINGETLLAAGVAIGSHERFFFNWRTLHPETYKYILSRYPKATLSGAYLAYRGECSIVQYKIGAMRTIIEESPLTRDDINVHNLLMFRGNNVYRNMIRNAYRPDTMPYNKYIHFEMSDNLIYMLAQYIVELGIYTWEDLEKDIGSLPKTITKEKGDKNG